MNTVILNLLQKNHHTQMIFKTDNTSSGSSNDNQVTLPLESTGTYNMIVYWGDGSKSTITAYNQAEVTHTYSSIGTYKVKIEGTCYGWRYNNTGDRNKLMVIKRWGKGFRLGNNNGNFYGCNNLTITATDVLDTTGTSTFFNLFRSCTSLVTIPSINNWNVSAVNNMNSAFRDITVFNQNINSWNVSACADFTSMFSGCTNFNQPLDSWVLKNTGVIPMGSMFLNCANFNQPLNSWNTSKVNNISSMFSGCTNFNQPLNSWVTSSITNMASTFNTCTAFNQGLNSWDTSLVTDMNNMFKSAINFNGNITSWNVSAVTTFLSMFQSASAFNQNISGWTLKNSGTITTANMFQSATHFNQDISGWNTSKITTMLSMFNGATAFNQNISSWNIVAVTTMVTMFSGVTLSTANYDALLIGWAAQGITNTLSFHAGSSKYTAGGAAAAARLHLTGTHGWTITDGGTA